MPKNGYFCIHCETELYGADRTICHHCRIKRHFVRKLKSLQPPSVIRIKKPVEEPSECIYSIRGKCNNAFSLNLGSECKGDIRCKKKERRDVPEEPPVLRNKHMRKVRNNDR